MKFTNLFVIASLVATSLQSLHAQCTVIASAQNTIIPCNGSTILSVSGSGTSQVAFEENFNNGQPIGWQFSQVVTIANNTCGVPTPDGSDFMWMGSQSVAPRTMATLPLDVSSGGTVCFDMRYAVQTGPSPCEGPDLHSEGVYIQYSIDAGATWNTIQYWDPFPGNIPMLTNWQNYCVTIPPAAQTSATQFRWTQTIVSSANNDHWGLDNVVISATVPNYNITWLHDGYAYGQGIYNGDNPTPVSPTGPTSYVVMMTDSISTCYDTITITVNYPQIDTTTTINPTCGSINGSLTAASSGGAGAYTYSIGGAFQTSGTFTNLDTAVYTIIMVDQNNCSDTMIATLDGVDSLQIVNLSSITTTCGLNNGVIDFDVVGGTPIFQYSIYADTTFSSTINFINLPPGVYPIYVVDQNGCFDTESIEIFPSTNPNIDNFSSNLEFCSLSDGEISSSTSLGITPYQFVIYQGSNLIATNGTGNFTGLQSGNYSLLVIDQIGCVDSVVVTVDSIPAPIAPLQDTILCNLTLQINDVLSYTGSNWSANTPLINFSNAAAQNPIITADTAGIYSITLTDSVCNFSETFQLTFVADPFTKILDTTLCIGETHVIAALVQPQNVDYLWSTGASTSAISVTETGNYMVTASNMCGVSIDSATIEFYFCDLELPNVFTPNGDGTNDYFQLLFFDGLKTFSCTILNRWGQTIREYDDPAFMWDGKDESGDDILQGVYFYIVKAVSNGGNEIVKQGNVTLVRSE